MDVALVVLRASMKRASAWVARGTVPAHVVELSDGWCAIVAHGVGYAQEPYEDAGVMTVCRPTPLLCRPSLGVLARGERASFVLHERALRAEPKWLLAQVGSGLAHSTLTPATIADVLALTRSTASSAAESLLTGASRPRPLAGAAGGAALAADIFASLGWPQTRELFAGQLPANARRVAPSPKTVRRFDATITAESEERREVESWLR